MTLVRKNVMAIVLQKLAPKLLMNLTADMALKAAQTDAAGTAEVAAVLVHRQVVRPDARMIRRLAGMVVADIEAVVKPHHLVTIAQCMEIVMVTAVETDQLHLVIQDVVGLVAILLRLPLQLLRHKIITHVKTPM